MKNTEETINLVKNAKFVLRQNVLESRRYGVTYIRVPIRAKFGASATFDGVVYLSDNKENPAPALAALSFVLFRVWMNFRCILLN